MKWLVLLSVVTLSTALPTLRGRHLSIGDDGTVTLIGSNGFEIDIFKSVTDPSIVDVILRSPRGPTRSFQIDEVNNIREVSDRNVFGYSRYHDFNQADILAQIFRQYQGSIAENQYYSLLNRIQLLVEGGVLNEAIYDVLREWNQYNLQDVRNLDRETLIQPLQSTLEEIREKRQLQQELLKSGKYFDLEDENLDLLLGEKYNTDKILKLIYKEQIGQLPINPSNVLLMRPNGEDKPLDVNFVDKFVKNEDSINLKIQEFIDNKDIASPYLIFKQRLLNIEVEKFIQQLAYHQNLINRQIEQYIGQSEVIPNELVYQQRLIFKQAYPLLQKLTEDVLFINRKIIELRGKGILAEREFFVQQKINSLLSQQLIKLLLVQQIHLKQQIQSLIPKADAVSRDLVLFQQATQEQLQDTIHSLIKQLLLEQSSFKDLVEKCIQEGTAIPQEFISHYYIIHKELLQLIAQGDTIPKAIWYQQYVMHQQIVFFLKQANLMTQPIFPLQPKNLLQQLPY
ncbi:uncharacterized protein LOC114328793 isoform X2 [Diabrotica virgifera virgifera]|uniref:Uncharacterized protein n=1 Tax=Diabrotica virgifera virgifera TaxID=50390 RepID=A0ABM5IIF6_DIAVI|nr:uncharacterized protein LOC114328793 isoform X2 [Diabrotica virgifera virgifera]